MALWVDAYRPKDIKSLTYHLDDAELLKDLTRNDDFPHLLVYGPNGAGKKTRIRCILRELFGPGAEKLRLDTQNFVAPSGKKFDLQTVASNYHVELSPGDAGLYDRVVVQEMVKQMASNVVMESGGRKFRVVVLMEVDRLTRDAQHALRRTMEKYSDNCRLILCCESLSRVIDPLRSRCLAFRVPAPTDQQMREALYEICRKTNSSFPESIINQVVEKARGNMRRAVLMLEATGAQGMPVLDTRKVPEPEWETYIKETAHIIVRKQNNDNLIAVRERLYEVISRCIPPNVIFTQLVRALLPLCNAFAQEECIRLAAEYEHRLTRGQKAIFHLEAFVASFMHVYLTSQQKDAEKR